MAINPYQTPPETKTLDEKFDPNRLPLLFSVPQNWKFYWVGMILMASVCFTFPVLSLIRHQGSWSVLTIIAPVPPLFMIWLGIRALLTKITVSNSGIRIGQFQNEIAWGEISYWTIGAYSNIVLTLESGRQQMIFGPATSTNRNKIIAHALSHFGIAERLGDSAG